MKFIRLNNSESGQKEDVNPAQIARVIDMGETGTTVVFADSTQVDYSESARSVRSYIKKSSEAKVEVAEAK